MAEAATVKLGKKAKIYIGADGANEIKVAGDITLGLAKGEADVSCRASDYKLSKGTLKEVSIGFPVIVDTADAGYAALLAGFYSDAPVEILCLEDAKTVTGAEGFEGDFEVMEFGAEYPLGDKSVRNVVLKPTYGSNLIERKTVAGA